MTGRARYTPDVKRPGLLHGKILGSPHPHARVHGIHTADAEAMPGVKAVVVCRTFWVAPSWSLKEARQARAGRSLSRSARRCRRCRDARAGSRRGRAHQVDFEVLPHVVDFGEARKPGAPLVFNGPVSMSGSAGGGGAKAGLTQKGNVRGPKRGAPRGKDASQMGPPSRQRCGPLLPSCAAPSAPRSRPTPRWRRTA